MLRFRDSSKKNMTKIMFFNALSHLLPQIFALPLRHGNYIHHVNCQFSNCAILLVVFLLGNEERSIR